MAVVQDLAAFLTGRWHVERTVTERLTGQSGTFAGALTVTPADDGALNYAESGTLRWGGHQTRASRRYVLAPTGDPAALHWYFATEECARGNYFHTMDLSAGRSVAEHLCVADQYSAEYSVVDSSTLHVLWTVTGPAKRQVLDSLWTRLDAD